MQVKAHYEHHLAHFYSWMTGDFDQNVETFYQFILDCKLHPLPGGTALDLGAGHGIQSREV